MAPTSSSRAGYTLVETMVALAILAVGAALVVPSGLRLIEQTRAHAVFLDFQRQAAALRLGVWRERRTIILATAPGAGPSLILEPPWSYRLSAPLQIGADGACTAVTADLLRAGERVMRLESPGRDCRFIQVAGRPPAPSSR